MASMTAVGLQESSGQLKRTMLPDRKVCTFRRFTMRVHSTLLVELPFSFIVTSLLGLGSLSPPVETESFGVFCNIICQCHCQEMVSHGPFNRWRFLSLLTESLHLRGQLMRMAP